MRHGATHCVRRAYLLYMQYLNTNQGLEARKVEQMSHVNRGAATDALSGNLATAYGVGR